ncbi:glycosyltransferase [Asaia krungthepensis]|uniref:glycosyltransferase n=1 Tax=Asaia krungthepensis TaxID=220990 RepID=UPI00222F0703|nr:glycosyltransferase [Asaia krungthepensis]
MAESASPPTNRPPPVQSGYGHVVTASDRANWQRWHDAKAQDAYRRGTDAVHAGETAAALYWLGRAARMAHRDPNVIFAYGMALLSAGRWEEAATRMAWVAKRFIIRKALVGQAIALSNLGRMDEAVSVFARMLSHYAPADEVLPWIRLFTSHSGRAGWCATGNDGVLRGEAIGPVAIALDGTPVIGAASLPFDLPEEWRQAASLSVEYDGKPLYGSPIDLVAIRQVQGFATIRAHHLEGWIWYPADPDFTPHVLIRGKGARYDLTADQLEQGTRLEKPLARPRHFSIALDDLPKGEIVIEDRYGQALTGSPIGPAVIGLLDRDAGQLTPAPDKTPPAIRKGRPHSHAKPVERAPGCLVVIPAYRDLTLTRSCIEAVLAETVAGLECLVIDDGSPEPGLSAYLRDIAGQGRITLIRHKRNLGFTASANAGLSRAAGRDVVLLNSDAIIPAKGLSRLLAWLDRDSFIGTATPFSNDASILSYPSVTRPNATPDKRTATSFDRIFASLPRSGLIDLPTGNGFCMAIRGDCLAQTGLLDVEVFAQGYGEENDFCCRASILGWRHVAATDVFVRHVGSVSFGRTRTLLLERNLRMLNLLHPGYDESVTRFIEADPLFSIRRNAGLVRMIARRKAAASCLVMVTHDSGGGVERVVRHRREVAEAEGTQVLILRPHLKGCRIEDCGGDTTNLVFSLPGEWLDLVTVLRRMKPARIEWHHLLGHAPVMHDLANALELRWDIVLHDYIWFCPRICLVGPGDHYCGEPALAGCESCVAQQGSLIDNHLTVAELVAQSDRILRDANRVVAGTHDLQRRMRRHFSGLTVELQKLESESYPAVKPIRPLDGGRRRVCVPGAIGREKGFDILLQLAQDAAQRRLPLDYVVVGYTIDDERLMATGHVQISGEYREEEAIGLIESFECDLGLIPSVWPETWCFALSNLWQARLKAVCFDLGAQSERIQSSGRGSVVPLGMPVSLLSNVLLHLSH